MDAEHLRNFGGHPPGQTVIDSPRWLDRLALVLVAGCTLAMAVCLYTRFLGVHRHVWSGTHHDRNAHYLFGLKMAVALEDGRVDRVAREINRSRVWGPLHGVLVAGVLVVGGCDYRLAVLPSLAGWVGTAIFAFLLVRRVVPRYGNITGCLASFFILISPGYQGYATDIMLESLGACFSLAALYYYLVAVQAEPHEVGKWPGRLLGLSLTLLFFQKANYWILVVLAILANELLIRFSVYRRVVVEGCRTVDWPVWFRRQLRKPSAYLLGLLLVTIVAFLLRGNRPLILAGRTLRVYPPFFFVEMAYIVAFLLLVRWWRTSGREWAGGFDPRYRQLITWHFWPVAIKLLLPKHLGYFLWYLSPAHSDTGMPDDLGLVYGINFYLTRIAEDYHAFLPGAILVGILIGLGILGLHRLKPGGLVVLLFVLISLFLAAKHPNMKSRFVHSWLTAGWVLAAAGLALFIPQRLARQWPRLSGIVISFTTVAIVAWHVPHAFPLQLPPHGGVNQTNLTDLEVTDDYLTHLDDSRKALILTTLPARFLCEWTALERFGEDRLEHRWFGFGPTPEANRQGFEQWLTSSPCDTIVYVDRAGGPTFFELVEMKRHGELRELLLTQKEFHLVHQREFPDHHCKVMVFQRPEHIASRAK